MTKSVDALRGILLKGMIILIYLLITFVFFLGWNIKYIIVQQAFLVTFIWTIIFLALTVIIFNFRRV